MPLVHTAHTLAQVKNALLADGDRPEPRPRIIGEEQVVAEADRLVANTPAEARDLVDLYGADPARVAVVEPGVDLDRFTPPTPGRGRGAARGPGRLGLPAGRAHGRLRRSHPAAEGARRAAAGASPSCASATPSWPAG